MITAEAISEIAGTYLFDRVGDAVASEVPQWDGEKWLVKVCLPHLGKSLGLLVFSAAGQLIASQSDSPALLEERANKD